MICFLNGDEMKSIFLVLFTVMLLTSCGEEKPAEEVNAPSFPVDTLEITGYIGEELGDSTNTFGVLSDAEYHENTGNILILDAGATCIKEYSPNGQYLRQISRRGSGPGELSIMTKTARSEHDETGIRSVRRFSKIPGGNTELGTEPTHVWCGRIRQHLRILQAGFHK